MRVQAESARAVPLVHRRSELPQLLGVSKTTVTRWIGSGRIRVLRPSPGVVLVAHDELLRFISDASSPDMSEAGPASPATATTTANGEPHDNGTTFDD